MPNSEMDVERLKNGIPGTEEVQERLVELDQTVRRLCRERPMAMLLGTLAVGFVIGRIVTK